MSIWTGQQISLVGSRAVRFAVIFWLAQQMEARSPEAAPMVLSLTMLASVVPQALVSLLAGAYVDRWNRRLVMLAADSIVALASLWLAYRFWIEATQGDAPVQVWHIYIVMMIRSLATAFHLPAMTASTSLMVPEKHLSRVAGFNQTMTGLLDMIGLPIGALLFDTLPPFGFVFFDVVTALPAVLMLAVVRIPQPRREVKRKPDGSEPHILYDIWEGIRYVWHWPGAMLLVGMGMLVYFVLAPTAALPSLLVIRHFGGGAQETAWFELSWGIGVLLGGLILGVWGGFRRRIYTPLMGLALLGVGFIVVGLAPSGAFWLAMVGNFVAGFMNSMIVGSMYAVLQANIDEDMQGRVFTLIGLSMATGFVSLLIAAPVTNLVGVQLWYLIGGVACLVLGCAAFFVPAIVRIERTGGKNRLPPLLMTSDPDSFARSTIVERKPHIIRQVIADNDYPPDIVAALDAFREEIASQPIRPLSEQALDVASWNEELSKYEGKTWLGVGWYFAEALFYRRLLEAVRYFQPGPWEGRDPFAVPKRSHIERAVAHFAAGWDQLAAADPETGFEALLHSCLWGNRADLSNTTVKVGAQGGLAARDERHNLLVDHTDAVKELVMGGLQRVDFINDNVGLDLIFDIALADFLLVQGWAREVGFHLKDRPFFVSDANPSDVRLTLSLLRDAHEPLVRAFGARVEDHVAGGRLGLRDDPFWTSCRMFCDFPPPLRDDLARADLVILKGDVNYRRLLGDRHWPHTTRLEDIAGYFPASFLVLRPLKGEIMVGLQPGQAEALSAEDSDWLIDGQRGIVQFVSPKRTPPGR
ncbi:MAG: MFS transporter [Anaerolineae bacterium]|nr:MFS transporter [Anaerolineae bacterium]